MIVEAVFIAAVLLVAYTHLGYPALVFAIGRVVPRRTRRADTFPKVSIVITACDEERVIAAKLENTLALDYPSDRLEILVASDCSMDRTDEIVREYAPRGVVLCRLTRRSGKTAAQYGAVRTASGDILVLSDASGNYRPDVVAKIVRNFEDPTVGCVSGRVEYVETVASAVGRGCRSYRGFEAFLMQCESDSGSLIGASGSLYAVRRDSFVRLASDLIDDFAIPLEVRLQGLRTVYEPEAVSEEYTNKLGRSEFRMRVRVAVRTLRALVRYRELLNVRKHGLFAVQLISHKLLRYLMPIVLAAAFVSSLLLAPSGTAYQIAFFGQVAFYTAALAGAVVDRLGGKAGPLALPYYFTLANAAAFVALVRFARGDSFVTWARTPDAGS